MEGFGPKQYGEPKAVSGRVRDVVKAGYNAKPLHLTIQSGFGKDLWLTGDGLT